LYSFAILLFGILLSYLAGGLKAAKAYFSMVRRGCLIVLVGGVDASRKGRQNKRTQEDNASELRLRTDRVDSAADFCSQSGNSFQPVIGRTAKIAGYDDCCA
jgi:hypothetical protein